jgi:hypothetical protein
MQKNEIQECVYFKTFSSPEQLTQSPTVTQACITRLTGIVAGKDMILQA